MTLPNIDELKSQAKRLRTALPTAGGQALSHSAALELVAKQYGYRDWNTLHAAAGNGPKVLLSLGDRVSGSYLKQPFAGEVVAIAAAGPHGHIKLAIQFDEPVDVVTFDSFSAYRSRVNCTVDENGVSLAKTSDGEPHIRVRRLVE